MILITTIGCGSYFPYSEIVTALTIDSLNRRMIYLIQKEKNHYQPWEV